MLVMRPYQTEDDYWRIRAFLREVMLLNGLLEKSWSVARLDYWRWHVALNCQERDSIADVTFMWETDTGRIAAVLNPEGEGDAHLQIHPEIVDPALEEEMIEVAEAHLAANHDGRQVVTVWTDDQNIARLELLKRRGYARGKWVEYKWRRDLDAPVPDAPIPCGYRVRPLGGVDELPGRSWASWRGFHPDEPDEKYEGWEWYHNIQRCPLYRRDLDIVAVAPTGEIASLCTLWYDDVTRSACIEPVATVPEHQRLGLARAVISEGLRRVQRMGAIRAFVAGYEPGPNALYSSVMSAQHDRSESWVKQW